MTAAALLVASCAALDLGAMEPSASAFLYRQGVDASSAHGAYYQQTISHAARGGAAISVGVALAGPPTQGRQQPAVVRYGFLMTQERDGAQGWARRTDYSALPDRLELSPGDSRTFEITQELSAGSRRYVRSGTLRLTHEGCGGYAFDDRTIEVHRIRLDATRHVIESGAPSEVVTSAVFELSPALGWWVKTASAGGAPLALVAVD